MSTDILARAETELTARVIVQIGRELGGRRWSQATLARALGVGAMWVSDRMTGRVRLTVEDLGRIADALDVDVLDLLPPRRRTSDGDGRPNARYVPIAELDLAQPPVLAAIGMGAQYGPSPRALQRATENLRVNGGV